MFDPSSGARSSSRDVAPLRELVDGRSHVAAVAFACEHALMKETGGPFGELEAAVFA
jgi:hypothetical protein